MLGEIVRSWKYPTRLVMVNLVPIGAFFLRFACAAASGSSSAGRSSITATGLATAVMATRLNFPSSLGVLIRSSRALSDSLRLSAARLGPAWACSSSLSEASEPASPPSEVVPGLSASGSVGASQPATLVDIERRNDLVHPLARGLVGLDLLAAASFRPSGDVVMRVNVELIVWPQLCFLPLRFDRLSTSSTTARGDLCRI
jgi:hypothetical protein